MGEVEVAAPDPGVECRLGAPSTAAAISAGTEGAVVNNERFEAIKALKAEGWTVLVIARHLGMDRKTARNGA